MGTEILHEPIIPKESSIEIVDRYNTDIVLPWLENGRIKSIMNIDDFRRDVNLLHTNEVNIANLDIGNINKSNRIEIGVLEFDGVSGELLAVFRPESGESETRKHDWNVPRFSTREVGAYEIDRELFGLVPPTILRTINGEKGSLRLYIDHKFADAPRYLPNGLFDEKLFMEGGDAKKMAVLDYLIKNFDRDLMTNLLVSKKDNAVAFAIDHDATFPAVREVESDIKGPRKFYRGTNIPLNYIIRNALDNFIQKEDEIEQKLPNDIRVRFEIDKESVFDRARKLLEANTYL